MNGHGGARPGAGRRPKPLGQKVLEGTATLGERRRHQDVEAVRSVPGEVPVPKASAWTADRVWAELAPHARVAGTLTPATAFAFRALCALIELRRKMLATITREGWQRTVRGVKRPHALATEHRALLQREEAGLARFCLAPAGREMADAVIPPETAAASEADQFAEFDGHAGGTH